MAEDKQDDILEEASDQEEGEQGSKGLSTSLLIKVAIGLGVLLIALIVAFFLFSSSPDSDMEPTMDLSMPEEEQTEELSAAPDSSVTMPETGTIELPDINTASPAMSPTANNGASTSAATSTTEDVDTTATPNNVLEEIISLQKQLLQMQQENQMLKQEVEDLTKEQMMRSSEIARTELDTSDIIMDDSTATNEDVPMYYRQSPYANSPQPELKPQWGDFERPKSK